MIWSIDELGVCEAQRCHQVHIAGIYNFVQQVLGMDLAWY